MTIGQKDKIRDWIERKFDQLHRITDRLPLGILDGVLHGTSRGIINFLLDNHPERNKCSTSGCSEILNFIKFLEQHELNQQIPVRSHILLEKCKTYNNLENLLRDLHNGVVNYHKQLGNLKLTFDNIHEIYYQQLELKKALKNEIARHGTILDQLRLSDIEILHELEVITQKLATINLGPETTDLMKRFTKDFLSEMKEIKATIADIRVDVKEVKKTTSDTNDKVSQIERLTKELNARQRELEKLLKQALGTN